ncbi:peptidoglycan-binding domain-containing protein, partial [Streptomyces misionensis]|uniref:peptidoglycan-binding domain-containing protein n=1 Tax=Streptomyces misionensis TaxID=67331 RepID=UPI001C98A48C
SSRAVGAQPITHRAPGPPRSAHAVPPAHAAAGPAPALASLSRPPARRRVMPPAPIPPSPPPGAPPSTPAGAPELRRGDVGPQVADLQFRLWQLDLYEGPLDGAYTRAVENGVRSYQQARGVQGDPAGVYGPRTRAALEAETSGR